MRWWNCRVRPHPFFRREGQDVHMDLNISLTEAVEGARVQAPTPSGPVTLTIPAGSNTGKVLRLKGKGVAGQGDQFVRLQVVLPDTGRRRTAQVREKMAETGLRSAAPEWLRRS